MVEINCDFEDFSNLSFGYYCSIKNSKIPTNVRNVKFIGKHEKKKSNASVTKVNFSQCKLQIIPENLSKIFPNVTTLRIVNSNFSRLISKEDVKGLEKLKCLEIQSCNLEYLPGNLLEDMKDLERINFNANQIKFIGENLLDGLTNLKLVNFYGNVNISLYFNADNPQISSTLEEIKREIREKCSPDYFLECYERPSSEWREREDNFVKKISQLEEKLKLSNERGKNLVEILQKKDLEINNFKKYGQIMRHRLQGLEAELKSKTVEDETLAIKKLKITK